MPELVAIESHPNYDPLLGIVDAANYLSMCRDTLAELARTRKIAVVRSGGASGGKMRFRLSTLNKWAESHELRPLRAVAQ